MYTEKRTWKTSGRLRPGNERKRGLHRGEGENSRKRTQALVQRRGPGRLWSANEENKTKVGGPGLGRKEGDNRSEKPRKKKTKKKETPETELVETVTT